MVARLLLGPAIMTVVFLFLLEFTTERRLGMPNGSRSGSNASLSRGAHLYVDYACVQCHGLGGTGRGGLQPSAPSLVSKSFKQAFPLDAAVADVIKNGVVKEPERVPSMPAWNGILSDDEIGYIVTYVKAGLPDMGVQLLPSATGEEIYRAFACMKCHGPLGTGGIRNAGATDPSHKIIPPIGGPQFKKKYDSQDKVRQVLLSGQLVEGGKPGVAYAPAWGKIGTAEQIEKVIGYLYSY